MGSFQSQGLTALELNSSTSRVLNLNKIYELHGREDEYGLYPFFQNKILNRSIIVKYKLNKAELQDYQDLKPICTKLVIPIDTNNIRMGVYYIFIGQRDFVKILVQKLNKKEQDLSEDLQRLDLIDSMITLDPFVIRECFIHNNISVSDCYLKIDDRISSSIQASIEAEMSVLLGMNFDDGENTQKFVEKLPPKPMGVGIGSASQDLDLYNYQIGQSILSMKTISYYKWKLKDILPKALLFASDLIKIFPRGKNDSGIDISRVKINIFINLYKSIKELKIYIDRYNEAYKDVIDQKNPKLFLKFLFNAPNVLKIIAERVDALDHIVGCWRLRFPVGTRPIMSHGELAELLSDFESSLEFETR